MDLSLFLAQAFGIYFVVLGVAMFRHQVLTQMIDDFMKNDALRFFAGIFILVLGILLVLTHNVWDGTYRVLITVLAWLTFLKGVAYLWLPGTIFRGIARTFSQKNWFMVGGIVAILLGVYLIYVGFGL